tara:strand:- start:15524 stop:15892 length:369 start_codon:yes stop_codon:yes gene_type:complete
MITNIGESKMIKLTDKETKLVQLLLDNNDGTDSHCVEKNWFNSEWCEHKKLGWSFETLRGVFGSIIDKGLLTYSQKNENGEWYQWYVHVSPEITGEDEPSIKTPSDYLNALEKQLIEERANV